MQKTRKSLGGAVEQFTVNMEEANHLPALKKHIAVFTPVMATFQQEHCAYKFQISVTVVFHEAVDPAVVTQPPVPHWKWSLYTQMHLLSKMYTANC